jgi:hypothetical protein
MRGGRAVAGLEFKAQLGAAREGTESMDYAAVVTYLKSAQIAAVCYVRILVSHEDWNGLGNPLATPTVLSIDRICHPPIRPSLNKSMSAIA